MFRQGSGSINHWSLLEVITNYCGSAPAAPLYSTLPTTYSQTLGTSIVYSCAAGYSATPVPTATCNGFNDTNGLWNWNGTLVNCTSMQTGMEWPAVHYLSCVNITNSNKYTVHFSIYCFLTIFSSNNWILSEHTSEYQQCSFNWKLQ